MINLGLSRIAQLLTRLPTSQTWTAIHIAGTNGKGSVAAYLSSLFRRLSTSTAEIKIGKFTSPHLIDRWDCITINDRPVSESLFLSVESQVKSLDQHKATEFELLTATAFEIFSRERCQVAVIECGLGGRLDATNALSNAAVCVITKVGLDHEGLLGNTVEEIAREKAGIAKKGVPLVIDGSNEQAVVDVVKHQAHTLGAEVAVSEADEVANLTKHQQQNLALALLAYKIASPRIAQVKCTTPSPDDIRQTLLDVQNSYPGRLQRISITSLAHNLTQDILLDGAHNPQSATVLREYVGSGPITWVLAMSRGKDLSRILSILLRPDDNVIACRFGPVDGMPWVNCVDPQELADASPCAAQTANDVVKALKLATGSNPVVVAGSLYLVSDLLRVLRDEPEALKRRLDRH